MPSFLDRAKQAGLSAVRSTPAGIPIGLAADLYKQYGRNKKHKVRIASKPKPLVPGGQPRDPAIVGGTGTIDYARGGQGQAGKRSSNPIRTSSSPADVKKSQKKKGQVAKNADAVQGVMDDLNEYG